MREPNSLTVIGMLCDLCFYIVVPILCVIGMGSMLLSVLGVL